MNPVDHDDYYDIDDLDHSSSPADEVVANILNLYDTFEDKTQLIQINDYINLVRAFEEHYNSLTSDPENFMTFGQFEELLHELQTKTSDANLRSVLTKLSQINGEDSVIRQKKKEYREKGIKLRKFRRYKSDALTLEGRLFYERMALIPSSERDKDKLKEIGITGFVYPIDEVFGFNRLPYKITIGAMLEIAKESSRCESYEEAEQILKEKTKINTNDDTMRHVTNIIGAIVFNNDMMIANNVWDDLKAGRLILPDTKINHTIYLEADGAMISTRQEGQKGSVYKENKLGMVFSSDQLLYWTDKHGKKKRKIKKREYTAFIGDCETFNKLFFASAIRNGYGKYKRTVLISDGAAWIRKMKQDLFPDALQILDFYHLYEHVSDYGKLLFNSDEDKYLPWSKEICRLFKESKTSAAIAALKDVKTKHSALELDKLLKYIENNKNNIDYAKYRANNYFIGSGAIESSNRTVLQRRLKYGAMRWNLNSGQAVVSLVAKKRSELWLSDVVKPVFSYYGEPTVTSWNQF
ncbi:MAG: hypothetical protein LBP22_12655 [Deltaproteobacteria bacterium]|jgi:hypothetical protein|nr:hypothetical protein [Deltaproteobacteria bacterium]